MPNPYLLLLIVALAAALAVAGWRMDALADERDAARAALEVRDSNDQVVTQYVEKIVKVPGPAVIRERLVRGMCIIPDVPGPGSADAAAGADTAYRLPHEAGRFAEQLSVELAAVQRNRLKLDALQEVLRPQVAQQ